jgi:hypothetical protein
LTAVFVVAFMELIYRRCPPQASLFEGEPSFYIGEDRPLNLALAIPCVDLFALGGIDVHDAPGYVLAHRDPVLFGDLALIYSARSKLFGELADDVTASFGSVSEFDDGMGTFLRAT